MSTTTTTTTTNTSSPFMETLLANKSRIRSASASTSDSIMTATHATVNPSPQTKRPTTRHPPLNTTFLGIPHPRFNESVVQFLGIKYAHVPMRWRQARLWTTFEATTDAGKYGPICPQPTQPAQTPEELVFGTCPPDLASTHYPLPAHDEFECLNLNITAPSGVNPHARLPVMVWVHGGGHRGSGSEWYYDPGSIVEKSIQSNQPVIWVTINFRIGLLGWATCPSIRDDTKAAGDEGAANFGLHDQRTALEWIHHHIAPFGGDPHNVTLIGAGTGAADIVYHLLSKKNGDAGIASPFCPFVSDNSEGCTKRCHQSEEVDPTSSAPSLIDVIEEVEQTGPQELPSVQSQVHAHAPQPHYPYRLFERAILQSPIFETVLADVNTAGWHLQRIMGALGITGCGGVNSKEGLEKLRAVDVSKIVNLGVVAANSTGRNAAAAVSAAAAAMSLRVVDDGSWFRECWQSFFQKEGGWTGRSSPVVSRHGLAPRSGRSKSRSRSKCRTGGRSESRDGRSTSRARQAHNHTRSRSHLKRIKTPFAMLQPIIIGDSPADALLWAHPISYWTATGVVRRLKAICASAGGTSSYAYSAASASATTTTSGSGGGVSSYLTPTSTYSSYGGATSSLGLSSNLLRAYELSSYVEDDEVGERVGEMVQDARIGWGVELVDRGVRRERGGADIQSGHGRGRNAGGSEMGGVWRYVFDQEGFGIGGPEQGDAAADVASNGPGGGLRGSPHYAADLVYLFDLTPVVPPAEEEVNEKMVLDDSLEAVSECEVLPPGSGTPTQMPELGSHCGKTKSRTKSQTQTASMLSPGNFAEGAWAETFDVDSDSDDEEMHPADAMGDLPSKGGRNEEPASIASLINVSQLSSKLEAHIENGGNSSEFSSSIASLTSSTSLQNLNPNLNPNAGALPGFASNAWLETPITPYTYNRVSCTLLEKWLRFSYGIAPWNDTKVFVFGPEGEVGERSREIFEARRKVKVWEDVLGPLGWATVLKVGVELSRGPVGGM
ncbi:hypothetical protein BJ165DRAFT_1406280 [Panaeolus papilionaceus]|nr:hypothetical protein BJ165DRAFT_1406280 [Panaeolus papilionaceus]